MSDNPAHIEQALAELAGTENTEQQTAARKRLDAAGYKQAGRERAAAAESTEDAEDGGKDSRKTPPKGRQTRQEAKGAST
jgi:hypothetical protein